MSQMLRKLTFLVISFTAFGMAIQNSYSDEPIEVESGIFSVLEGEVMEVEVIDETEGRLEVSVRDLIAHKDYKLYADPYRTTVQILGRVRSLRTIRNGNKGRIIYQQIPGQALPTIVYFKITDDLRGS